MKHPQFFIFQGSTPTLAFSLPYSLSDTDTIYATFSQGEQTVTEYTKNGTPISPAPSGELTVDEDNDHCIHIDMSQEDTFLFETGDCELQIRVKKSDGRADTLFPVLGTIGKAQKGTVIN